jgi:hypothetical protein
MRPETSSDSPDVRWPPNRGRFSPPAAVEPGTGSPHRPQPAPREYRCTCGRLREACLHDAVADLWAGQT